MTTQERREFGHLFRRPASKYWWIRYKVDGKSYRESTHSTSQRAAEKLLDRRQAELGLGRFVEPNVKRTSFEDLAQMVRDDYQVNGRRSGKRLETSLVHLTATFGGARVASITADRVSAYVRQRLDEGAAPATVRNELAALKRMFTLGIRAGKVTQRPYIPSLQLQNTRTGFFEEPDFRTLAAELPDHLRAVVTFAYCTGWRTSSEVLPLTWAQVNFEAGVVRLEPGTTKNQEGRTFPFGVLPELETVLHTRREYTTVVERRLGCVIPWVFHRNSQPLKGFRRAWLSACRRAGLVGMIPHDFRRTAVRNLVRAGVSEHTAMKLTGHKTRSVFDRYDIVDEADLREGVAKLAARAATQETMRRSVLPMRGTRGAQ